MSVRLSTALPPGLLGAHVGGGPENDPLLRRRQAQRGRLRQALILPIARKRLRQSEVQHLHLAVGSDLDVGGFQVAVDHSFFMGRFESLGDLECELEGFFNGDRTTLEPVSL